VTSYIHNRRCTAEDAGWVKNSKKVGNTANMNATQLLMTAN